MISKVDNLSTCMRSQKFNQFKSAVDKLEEIDKKEKTVLESSEKKLTKRQIYDLIFDHCAGCNKMAAVPQSAFAVRKVRKMMILKIEKQEEDSHDNRGSGFKKNLTESRELAPLKYNSKLMNSIWGLYNRYSVHNFKKNTDPEANTCASVLTAALEDFFDEKTSQATTPAEVVANAAVKH